MLGSLALCASIKFSEVNMNIKIRKAEVNDAKIMHEMQLKAFAPLLEKYQDFGISPGAETIERIIQRLNQTFTDYYIIEYQELDVGAIRVINILKEGKCRIGPIFILHEFQNRGIAQAVFKITEDKYKPKNGWILDTILEEKGNCYLYEKIGYRKTG